MAIVGYLGSIGSGKTYNATRDVVAAARRRRAKVVSNMRIRPGPGIEFEQLTMGHDGIDVERLGAIVDESLACDVCTDRDAFGDVRHNGPGCERYGLEILIDEVGILMPARFWQDFPIDLFYQLSQSRKNGANFTFTAQAIDQVDKQLRDLCTWVWLCKVFPLASIERTEDGRRPWFFLLSKWKAGKVEGQFNKPLGRRFRRYDRSMEGVYSTFELVRPPAIFRERQSRRRARGAVVLDAAGVPDATARGGGHLTTPAGHRAA